MNEWMLGYLLLGAVAGFFAGLLGVGGGAIMVPVLALMFSAQGFPKEHLMHLALGTSMAAIVFTSISSLRACDSISARRGLRPPASTSTSSRLPASCSSADATALMPAIHWEALLMAAL